MFESIVSTRAKDRAREQRDREIDEKKRGVRKVNGAWITCSTRGCQKHPHHEHADNKWCAGPRVGCFKMGEPEFSFNLGDVSAGQAQLFADCLNYEKCEGCKVCKPLPGWASDPERAGAP